MMTVFIQFRRHSNKENQGLRTPKGGRWSSWKGDRFNGVVNIRKQSSESTRADWLKIVFV